MEMMETEKTEPGRQWIFASGKSHYAHTRARWVHNPQSPDGVALQTYFEDLLGNLRNWFAATAPFNQRLQTAFLNAGVPSWSASEPHLDLDYHMRRWYGLAATRQFGAVV